MSRKSPDVLLELFSNLSDFRISDALSIFIDRTIFVDFSFLQNPFLSVDIKNYTQFEFLLGVWLRFSFVTKLGRVWVL